MIFLHRALAVLTVLAAAAVIVQGVRAHRAGREADAALDRLAAARGQIRTILALRADTPEWMRRARPSLMPGGAGGLAGAANECIAAAGLPQAVLASLSPSTDAPIMLGPAAAAPGQTGLSVHRRRAVMTLAPLTLPQVGRVLDSWRKSHADWVITSIDLSPDPPGRREPEPGSDLPLRAVLTIETLFVEQAHPTGDRR